MRPSLSLLAGTFGASALAAALDAFADAAPAATGHIFAAPQPAAAPVAPGVGGLGQVALALLVVLTAVFAVAWLVRRMRGLGGRLGNAIDVIAQVPLGQKEHAVLLKVGRTQILVGVAPGQVRTLHVLAEPIDLTAPAGAQELRPSFKTILLRSLGK